MSDDLVERLLDGIVAPDGAFDADPPVWAQDPFNGDIACKCGRCGAWCSVVRPGKTQCDYCCDNDEFAFRIKAAARIEALEAENARLLAGASERANENTNLRNDLVLIGMARDAAESALAEAVEVMRPFGDEAGNLSPTYSDTTLVTWISFLVREFRAARAFVQQHEGKK